VDFFLWMVEFFKIGERDFTFIREMRGRSPTAYVIPD
jgi:hypothetical protein